MSRALALTALLFVFTAARADDWPMWGRDQTRNMVSPEKNPPTDWQVDGVKAARNIKWSAQLGSRCMAAPVVANSLVWIGTNNANPRDPNHKKDASVLMCFRESDGKFLWQYVSPRLDVWEQDSPQASLASAPVLVGDTLWFITNRWETLCLDVGPLRRGDGNPKELWKVDMRKEFGVIPYAPLMASGFSPSLPAPYKDHIYAVTGNGIDRNAWDGKSTRYPVPAPKAPGLVCLNKTSGKVIWQDNSPGKDIIECQLSSPLLIEVKGKTQVVAGQGDGWLRAFDAESGKLIWKCDLNPKDAKYELFGRATRNDILATPVLYQDRIFIATGQDPEHYEGVGHLYCIDPTKTGDISRELDDGPGKGKPNPNSGVVWHYGGPTTKEDQNKLNRDYYFGRTQSTVAVQDGLVYAAELAGYLHCLDSRTGKVHWVHDLRSAVWGSPLWVDGKIYVPTEDGDIWIFTHDKEKKEPKKIGMPEAIRTTPIFANGVLYIAAESRLYAIHDKK